MGNVLLGVLADASQRNATAVEASLLQQAEIAEPWLGKRV